MKATNRLGALMFIGVLYACASAPKTPIAGQPLRSDDSAYQALYEMPEILLRATPDGYRSWADEQLFEAGNDAYDEAEWRDAIAHFDQLAKKYPDSTLVPAALFNAGLASLHERNSDRAESYFAALAGRFPANELAASALWNLTELREKREAWRQVLDTIDTLRSYDLNANDVFEIEARAWIARTILKPTDGNLAKIQESADAYDKRIRRGQALGRETLARLYWTIGEVYLGRSQSVVVDPESEHLEQDLERKADSLLRAQEAYMQTVKSLEPTWATAAVFRIGFAYESFYSDLIAAPAPETLQNEERSVYFEEVRAALAPVKQKAELAYERIIRFSKQYGVDTDWIKQAEERLSRLQRLKIPSAEAS